jgi:S1-C subfamily serine protease
MNELMTLETIERYLRGEMTPDERTYLENLRKTNPEVDQLVVEHALFLQQMESFSDRRNFKSELQHIHTELTEKGDIKPAKLEGKAKVVYLWKRYKRVAAIAASIAIITTLSVSLLVNSIMPRADKSELQSLSREVKKTNDRLNVQTSEVNTLKNKLNDKTASTKMPFRTAGTGFMLDGKGLLATNAHIVKNSKNIFVVNNQNQQFRAIVVFTDLAKDIAILKIADDDFKPITSIPYGIRKSSTDVAEPIYTMGFPRNEIVYSEGYMSAKTGHNDDSLTCQLGIAANPGNSGGPVFNQAGEVIGILSTKEADAEGVAFAIQSKYLFNVLDDLKKNDTAYQRVKLPARSSLNSMNRQQQVKKIQDFVYMIKVN